MIKISKKGVVAVALSMVISASGIASQALTFNSATSQGQQTSTLFKTLETYANPIVAGLMPVASGKSVYSNEKAKIDASNTVDGYVMITYTGAATGNLKVIVAGPSGVKYTYNLTGKNGNYDVFPLSDGNGNYSIGVYEGVGGTKYSVALSQSVSVSLKNEFAPFILPNQYVNYSSSSTAVAKAKELVSGKSTDLEKIGAVYNYVVSNLTYDKQKAATVQSGYLPVIDSVLASKKGICFDYAALMTAMLRSQGIPCKLVVGYAGTVYHAWISAYTAENGWVEQVVMFDGKSWKLMDPTFASSSNNNPEILKYIGNGSNYSVKYLY
ncbi:MAG: transglutaminase-like domain-containing protein [Anaerotignaceae bacterium]